MKMFGFSCVEMLVVDSYVFGDVNQDDIGDPSLSLSAFSCATCTLCSAQCHSLI